jgi:hypothetical protein
MTNRNQQSFPASLRELERNFSDGGHPDESDTQIADAILDHILQRERLRRGVVDGTAEADAVDNETLTKMAEWDTDDVALSNIEKFLRRLAKGRGVDAITFLKKVITNRQQAVSDEQRRRASTPRERNPLDKLIENIIAKDPSISAKELIDALSSEVGNGVIAKVGDFEIQLVDRSLGPVKVAGVKDRLTRIKKRIAKAG